MGHKLLNSPIFAEEELDASFDCTQCYMVLQPNGGRVESHVDSQPHRKVILPVAENLDEHAKMLMGVIQEKMSK